jgi:hypothetical protein
MRQRTCRLGGINLRLLADPVDLKHSRHISSSDRGT